MSVSFLYSYPSKKYTSKQGRELIKHLTSLCALALPSPFRKKSENKQSHVDEVFERWEYKQRYPDGQPRHLSNRAVKPCASVLGI